MRKKVIICLILLVVLVLYLNTRETTSTSTSKVSCINTDNSIVRIIPNMVTFRLEDLQDKDGLIYLNK
jgi:hypothetical protein